MSEKNKIGKIGWFDLTVENADEISGFYSKVIGWEKDTVDMGEYSDYNMKTPFSDEIAAGICHKRGTNKNIPSKWMLYITVENIEESCRQTTLLGGKLISEIKDMGGMGKYCFIEDPAGAVCALYEQQ